MGEQLVVYWAGEIAGYGWQAIYQALPYARQKLYGTQFE